MHRKFIISDLSIRMLGMCVDFSEQEQHKLIAWVAPPTHPVHIQWTLFHRWGVKTLICYSCSSREFSHLSPQHLCSSVTVDHTATKQCSRPCSHLELESGRWFTLVLGFSVEMCCAALGRNVLLLVEPQEITSIPAKTWGEFPFSLS